MINVREKGEREKKRDRRRDVKMKIEEADRSYINIENAIVNLDNFITIFTYSKIET